jgi:hypothetical protein
MVTIFMVNEDIARGMVCFFHQKKHSYLIYFLRKRSGLELRLNYIVLRTGLWNLLFDLVYIFPHYISVRRGC